MKVYQSLRILNTKSTGTFLDLTSILEQELEKSNIQNGILICCVLHTTCAVILQETDQAVHNDSKMVLENIVPLTLNFEHIYEGAINAAAHQKQMLIGNSIIIPIKEGSLILGSWQKPFLVEFFRAMQRKVFITIIGE